MSCNRVQHRQEVHLVLVSIPIGFSNELQLRRRTSLTNASAKFQSLSGFPMSCNHIAPQWPQTARPVSIPIGFSNELQRPVR